MPQTSENGYNQAMTESGLRKISEYVDEIVQGLYEFGDGIQAIDRSGGMKNGS